MERKNKIKYVIIISVIMLGVSAICCAAYNVNKNSKNQEKVPENKAVVQADKTNENEISDMIDEPEKANDIPVLEEKNVKESKSTAKVNNGGSDTSAKEKIEVEIEGLKNYFYVVEQKNVENNGVVYDIKISEDMKATHNGKSDRYESKNNGEKMKNGNTCPDSYMVITVYNAEDKEGVQETYADMYEMYYENNAYSRQVTIGKENYSAIHQHYLEGFKWNSKCHDVYMIDVNDDKFMVIDIQTFVEASEGWNTLVGELLKTLEIHK